MAAWKARGGEPARAQPNGRSAAKFAGPAVLAMALSVPSGAYADGAVIYVNAPQGQLRAALGSDLRQSLASKLNYTLAEVDTDQAVMQRIAADPGSVGLVQRDQYVQYLRDHSDRQTRFEFYGNIHACLMVVVRKGSQIQTYGDLVRARAERATTLDVGPATGQLAATFANLRQMDGSLGYLAVRNRGGARALGQVLTGETDAALFLVLAPFTDGLVGEVINSNALDLVPFFSEDIVLGAARGNLPYLLRQIKLGGSGWFSAGRPYHTTCTSVGAVVNAQADARLSEQIAHIMLEIPERERPWYATVGSVLVAAVSQVGELLVVGVKTIPAWLGIGAPVEDPAPRPGVSPSLREVSDRPVPTAPPRGSPGTP